MVKHSVRYGPWYTAFMSTDVALIPSQIEFYAATHVGLVRRNNEDAFVARGNAIVLSDGMGGHPGGEVASALSVMEIRRALALGHSMEHAFDMAQAAVKSRKPAGMGAVVVAARLHLDRVTIGHCGDARAYLNGRQVTEDHSHGPYVSKAIGTEYYAPTVVRLAWKRGDTLLLCSDGLLVRDALPPMTGSPKHVCEMLIRAALDKGGHDNVTVVFVRRN
jgi:PPM family protein phosphatase